MIYHSNKDKENFKLFLEFNMPVDLLLQYGMSKIEKFIFLLFSIIFLVFIASMLFYFYNGNYSEVATYIIGIILCYVFLKSRLELAKTKANFFTFYLSSIEYISIICNREEMNISDSVNFNSKR